MKIIVLNNSSEEIPLPDGTSVPVGGSKTMTGRTKEEVTHVSSHASSLVIVRSELESSDRAPLVCDMKGDATASGTNTQTGVGFDLKDQSGVDAGVNPKMYLGVYDDAACTVPAENADIDTAATGTINSGSGTNLLEVTPDATGEFSATLNDVEDETVYVKAWPKDLTYVIDSAEKQTVEFTT